jgi:hypothetical protein
MSSHKDQLPRVFQPNPGRLFDRVILPVGQPAAQCNVFPTRSRWRLQARILERIGVMGDFEAASDWRQQDAGTDAISGGA